MFRLKKHHERDWLENLLIDSVEKALPDLEDTAENRKLLSDIFKNSIPRIIDTLEKHISKKSNILLWYHRRQTKKFKRKLLKLWKKPIKSLEIFIALNLEQGENIANSLKEKKVESLKFATLLRIHARAVQIALEVLELIKNGFADGALARWRSLYELSIIATFLGKNDDNLCQRYLDYKLVEDYYEAIEYQKHCDDLGYTKLSDDEFAELETTINKLKVKYGSDFTKQYGWIGEVLPKNNWNFKGIEETIDFKYLRPFYKLANNYVHSGAKGFLFKMGTYYQDEIMLAGPSNYGFADAGQNTAHSLLLTTMTLTNFESYFEDVAFILLSERLLDKLSIEFVETQKQFEDEL